MQHSIGSFPDIPIQQFALLFLMMITAMTGLSAQERLHSSMSADEFRHIRPGILPEESSYSDSIGLDDAIIGIPGKWNLTLSKDLLVSTQFHWRDAPKNERGGFPPLA